MSRNVALGDLFALSRSPSVDIVAWLSIANTTLGERIQKEALAHDESIAQFVRIAVADFMAEASEEDWADLMSAVRDANDPGAACLAKMTAFRIAMEVAA